MQAERAFRAIFARGEPEWVARVRPRAVDMQRANVEREMWRRWNPEQAQMEAEFEDEIAAGPAGDPAAGVASVWTSANVGTAMNFGATSEQQRPNTTENPGSSGTRRRSQALRNTTLYGLQNLHPRFKSGRRLQTSLGNLQVLIARGLACGRTSA